MVSVTADTKNFERGLRRARIQRVRFARLDRIAESLDRAWDEAGRRWRKSGKYRFANNYLWPGKRRLQA